MVDVAGQAVVAVLTRAPSAGGKSRLFRALGRPFDPALPAALLLDTLDALAPAGGARVVCFTPDDADEELRALVPAGVQLVPQGGGDLGRRMRSAFDVLLGAGARSVVLVGSDLPLVDANAVAGAHRLLRKRPRAVVLGPAADGGYYLIGAARTPSALLDGIAWGTAGVLAQTVGRAASVHIEVILVAGAADVDTPEDLRRLVAAPGGGAPRTRAWAARWL